MKAFIAICLLAVAHAQMTPFRNEMTEGKLWFASNSGFMANCDLYDSVTTYQECKAKVEEFAALENKADWFPEIRGIYEDFKDTMISPHEQDFEKARPGPKTGDFRIPFVFKNEDGTTNKIEAIVSKVAEGTVRKRIAATPQVLHGEHLDKYLGRFPTSGSTYFDVANLLRFTFTEPISAFGMLITDAGDFPGELQLTGRSKPLEESDSHEFVLFSLPITEAGSDPNGNIAVVAVESTVPFIELDIDITQAPNEEIDILGFDDLIIAPASRIKVECGDGFVGGEEECDGGEGCTEECTCEKGWDPANPARLECVDKRCGNNRVDLDKGEMCDGGKWCTDTCQCVPGQVPDGANGCTDKCGNNMVTGEETCDGSSFCNAQCECEPGYIADATGRCVADCGDGIAAEGEECDSGENSANHCRMCEDTLQGEFNDCKRCSCEQGYESTFVNGHRDGTCSPRCGNGIVTEDEECEPGFDTACTTECLCGDGTSPENGVCVAVCGDGKLAASEECDSDDAQCINCQCSGDLVSDGRGGCTELCGNGMIDSGEQCDGGKDCFECVCQEGFIPDGKDGCKAFCGDNIVAQGVEDCDGGENCNAECKCDPGYIPENGGYGCTDSCDGIIQSGEEECDGGDYCVNCHCKKGTSPTFPPSRHCEFRCGNGQLDAIADCDDCGEQCDGGAHCTDECKCEPGFIPDGQAGCVSFCGDGAIAKGVEECDTGPFCNDKCQCREGFVPSDHPDKGCTHSCDGIVQSGDEEECDGGDHCLENCLCEPNYAPTFPRSRDCVKPCGNGAIDVGEQCEKGRHCDNDCQCKTGYVPDGHLGCILEGHSFEMGSGSGSDDDWGSDFGSDGGSTWGSDDDDDDDDVDVSASELYASATRNNKIQVLDGDSLLQANSTAKKHQINHKKSD